MAAPEWLSLDEIAERDARYYAATGRGHPASCLKAGCASPNGVAVSGADGHLFIGNGANRWERQYAGELTVDPSWIAAWRALLARRQAQAAKRGVELWNIVVPEKQAVLADLRWSEPPDGAARRPLKQLLEAITPEARLVYPQAELQAARRAAPVFFRHNSHWTPFGCATAALALARAMGLADAAGVRFPYVEKALAQDLSVHFFEPPPVEVNGWLGDPGPRPFDNRLLETTGRHTGASYGLRNDRAPDPRRVLIVGDSFSYDAGFAPALAALFQDVVFVWSKSIAWEDVERHGAAVVVWESAERFLVTLPSA